MKKLLPLLFLFACQPTKTQTSLAPIPPTQKTTSTTPQSTASTITVPTMRDRDDFSKRLSRLKVGAPAAEVKKLLGAPDDIRTPTKDGIVTSRTREVWCYGADAHKGFPTLGWVYLDEKDQVQYLWGVGAVTAGLPAEAELVPLLKTLDQVPALQGYEFRPQPLIAAVNALHPLGKDKALAVLSEYLRVSSPFDSQAREGMFLVLRALFEVPADPGYMPVMMVGGPSPAAPKDPKVFPRFPLYLEGDVPLLLVSGYSLGGKAQDPEDHIKYFAEKGVLRGAPLHPIETPTKILKTLVDTSPVFDSKQTWGAMLADQLLSLLSPVYQAKSELEGEAAWWKSWKKISAEIETKKLRWDTNQQQYLAE
jgi:hypothetical protein